MNLKHVDKIHETSEDWPAELLGEEIAKRAERIDYWIAKHKAGDPFAIAEIEANIGTIAGFAKSLQECR